MSFAKMGIRQLSASATKVRRIGENMARSLGRKGSREDRVIKGFIIRAYNNGRTRNVDIMDIPGNVMAGLMVVDEEALGEGNEDREVIDYTETLPFKAGPTRDPFNPYYPPKDGKLATGLANRNYQPYFVMDDPPGGDPITRVVSHSGGVEQSSSPGEVWLRSYTIGGFAPNFDPGQEVETRPVDPDLRWVVGLQFARPGRVEEVFIGDDMLERLTGMRFLSTAVDSSPDEPSEDGSVPPTFWESVPRPLFDRRGDTILVAIPVVGTSGGYVDVDHDKDYGRLAFYYLNITLYDDGSAGVRAYLLPLPDLELFRQYQWEDSTQWLPARVEGSACIHDNELKIIARLDTVRQGTDEPDWRLVSTQFSLEITPSGGATFTELAVSTTTDELAGLETGTDPAAFEFVDTPHVFWSEGGVWGVAQMYKCEKSFPEIGGGFGGDAGNMQVNDSFMQVYRPDGGREVGTPFDSSGRYTLYPPLSDLIKRLVRATATSVSPLEARMMRQPTADDPTWVPTQWADPRAVEAGGFSILVDYPALDTEGDPPRISCYQLAEYTDDLRYRLKEAGCVVSYVQTSSFAPHTCTMKGGGYEKVAAVSGAVVHYTGNGLFGHGLDQMFWKVSKYANS